MTLRRMTFIRMTFSKLALSFKTFSRENSRVLVTALLSITFLYTVQTNVILSNAMAWHPKRPFVLIIVEKASNSGFKPNLDVFLMFVSPLRVDQSPML